MKYYAIIFSFCVLLFACSREQAPDNKGVGAVTKVELSPVIDADMVNNGRIMYETKCRGCHALTDEMEVGPGWKGITKRRTPEWIMNMITNVNVMLVEDPDAQALLDNCFTRMPNQKTSFADARHILEFMRSLE
jgi:hypothetical protein